MSSFVALEGIRHRRGLSLVVFVLAVVATATAVIIPTYTAAAKASLVRDAVQLPAPTRIALTVTKLDSAEAPAEFRSLMSPILARDADLAGHYGPPILASTVRATLTSLPGVVVFHTYRQDVCAHVTMLAGRCPASRPGWLDEVMISDRSARSRRMSVGSTLSFTLPAVPETNAPARARKLTVVGVYDPTDQQEAYWGSAEYFAPQVQSKKGESTQDEFRDPLFVADPEAVVGQRATSLAYPLLRDTVTVDNVEGFQAELEQFIRQVSANQAVATTGLSAALGTVRADQDTLDGTLPLAALPLVLLCWFVLFLAVATVIGAQGPEIALAKLRGFRLARTVRFGLAEALVLIVAAAPFGLAVGVAFVAAVARFALADGVGVTVDATTFAAAGVAVLGGAVSAVLAARTTLATPVLALLRRVPARSRVRTAVGEGVVLTLAAVALYEVLWSGQRDATLTLFAPPLLSLVAGLLSARALAWWCVRRLRGATRTGKLTRILASAQLGRRGATARLALLVTVAVALLGFSTTIWSVAAYNRELTVDATLGADAVYQVKAATPQSVRAAVAQADPTGRYAMAALRITDTTFDRSVTILGVDAARFGALARWPGGDTADAASAAALIGVDEGAALAVTGPTLTVDVTVRTSTASQPIELLARIAAPGAYPREVPIGLLRAGAHSYTGALADCAADCRLVGLVWRGTDGRYEKFSLDATVTGLRDGDRALPAPLTTPARWRAADGQDGNAIRLSDAGGLGVAVDSDGRTPVTIRYLSLPEALPAVVAGPTPGSDPSADQFELSGTAVFKQLYRPAAHRDLAAGAGERGLLVDFDALVWSGAETSAPRSDSYEVWVSADAPASLPKALAAAGLQLTEHRTRAAELDQLNRGAPALGFWLYLIAGVVSVLVAVGAVLLHAFVGAGSRLYELAALRAVGVGAGTLRSAMRSEYALLLGVPFVTGTAVGLLSAQLMVDSLPLVSAGVPAIAARHTLGVVGLFLAAALVLAGFAAVTRFAVRLIRRATPDLLRSGAR